MTCIFHGHGFCLLCHMCYLTPFFLPMYIQVMSLYSTKQCSICGINCDFLLLNVHTSRCVHPNLVLLRHNGNVTIYMQTLPITYGILQQVICFESNEINPIEPPCHVSVCLIHILQKKFGWKMISTMSWSGPTKSLWILKLSRMTCAHSGIMLASPVFRHSPF